MTTITINIQNDSPATQNFLYFIPPVSSGSGASAYCTSLGTAALGNYDQTGTILTFMLDFEYRAGVQQAYSLPAAGQQSGFYSASQRISLSAGDGTTACATTMLLDPLSLSQATTAATVPKGMFRITTPSYDSGALTYNAGTALRTAAGGVVLPGFVVASPGMNIDLRPVRTFCVVIGSAATGIVIVPSDFTNTATCDATTYTSFEVLYSAAGAFTVKGYVDAGMSTKSVRAAVPSAKTSSSRTAPKRIVVTL